MSETEKAVKPATKSPRRRAREFALQGLYQWRVGGANEAAIEAHMPELEGFAKAENTHIFLSKNFYSIITGRCCLRNCKSVVGTSIVYNDHFPVCIGLILSRTNAVTNVFFVVISWGNY